jgi:RNA polymerase sigma-70 factor (ECF subfamily)
MVHSAAKPEGDAPLRAGGDCAVDFAAEFQSSFRVLWLIAVGVIGDASLAEDVVQEAAIIALGKLDQYRPGTNFTAWTGQIVRNVARNRARRERRHRAAVTDPTLMEGQPSLTGRNLEASWREVAPGESSAGEQRPFDEHVLQALGDVGEVARACLLLRTLEGLEYSEISRLLEIPEGTAMSHVHRTRRYLRDRLADVWEERTGRSGRGGVAP